MVDRSSDFTEAPAVDPLSELLLGMRLRGAGYGRLQLAAPWGVGFPQVNRARFHFVAAGTVILRAGDGAETLLKAGDAVLLPRGDEHSLLSGGDVEIRDIGSYASIALCSEVRAISEVPEGGDRSGDALIFTASMMFELCSLHPLLKLMPDLMTIQALDGKQPEVLGMLAAMESEMMALGRAGSAGILARLADVVAAFIVRNWLESGCGSSDSWIQALRDPRLGKVIVALHRDPGRDWTLNDMADEMGSSRSVFAQRFADTVGTTPQRYLLELRMRLAEEWFRRDKLPIDTIAGRLGFGSQAAFTRAFKRVIGQPPGKVRAWAIAEAERTATAMEMQL